MRASFLSGTLTLILVCAGAGVAPANAQRTPNRAELNILIDSWAANLVQANEISGTVLVARGNDILYHKAFGPGITTETPFPVASLTKPLTVILALNLVEAGRLALTDTLGQWLPGFPRGGRLTVDMLLRHRAGIPHRVTQPDDENTRRTATDMVRLVAMTPPLFPPDSTRRYSSAGYAVIARVLELAGGKSYGRLVDSIVFRPAGAIRSQDATEGVPPGAPGSLVFTSSGLAPAPAKDLSFLVGGGSVYSTPEDFFRIMRRLVAGGYGEAARQRLSAQNGDLSWNGVTNGYRAFADYEAGTDLMVIFMGNRFTGATDLIRRDFPRLARGEQVAPPVAVTPEPHPLPAELQRRYAGRYQINDPATLTFETPTFAMVGSYPVYPTSDTTFYSPQDYLTVRVERDAAGTATALIWGDNRFPRVSER
jgi:CubicO group peptidase (beta-lactamase class C family)